MKKRKRNRRQPLYLDPFWQLGDNLVAIGNLCAISIAYGLRESVDGLAETLKPLKDRGRGWYNSDGE